MVAAHTHILVGADSPAANLALTRWLLVDVVRR